MGFSDGAAVPGPGSGGPRFGYLPEMIRALAESARVSNLPTIWTNVLAGAAIAGWGGGWSVWPVVLALLAASLLYTGGMLLNDLIDAPWDREHKRDRPIAAGRLSARLAGSLAMACLLGGLAIATLHGSAAAGYGGALVGCVVLYNLRHKRSPLAVIYMAGCRALLYPFAAAVVLSGAAGAEPAFPVWPASAAVGVYTLLLTLAARREDQSGARVSALLAWLVPFPFLAAAMAYPADRLLWTLFAGAAFFAWCAVSARHAVRGQIREAVLGWLSGFCLADAFLLCLVGRLELAPIAVIAWLATAASHRFISGT